MLKILSAIRNPQSAFALDCHRENLALQPRAAARRANLPGHPGADAVFCELAVRCFVEPLHLRGESLKRLAGFCPLRALAPLKLNRAPAGAVRERLPKISGQLAKRHVERHAIRTGKRVQDALVKLLHPLRRPRPRQHRAVFERPLAVDHQVWIAHRLRAESLARRARAEVAVEGKMFGREIGNREVGFGIAEIGRVFQLLPRFDCGLRIRSPILQPPRFPSSSSVDCG